MPTASVIVPNYNHARFLRRRLDTILEQTYQDFELILLDDCSTDESRSILSEYASDLRVRLEFNEVNSGSPFKQWNKGVRMARGKYAWVAESDDYADVRFLERLAAILDTDESVQFAYCQSWRLNERNQVAGFGDWHMADWLTYSGTRDFKIDGRKMCREYFCGTNAVPNASAVLFRRATFERVGGADESLRICGDWKLWAAMALEGQIAYVAEPLDYFRFHRASVRERAGRARTGVAEHLLVSRWIVDRVGEPRQDVLRTMHEQSACLWVPAMLSLRLPRKAKRQLWRLVREMDSHPLRSAMQVAPRVVRKEVFQRSWYALLDATYRRRHAVGLSRRGLAQLRARLGMR